MPPKKRTLSALSGNEARPKPDSTSRAKRPARRLVPQPTTLLGASMPPEIWSIIGEKLLDANAMTALKSLSRVCKSFSSMFLPLLYSRRIIQLERFANSLGNESVPPGLEYVKDYQVNISEFCRSGYYDPLENEDYSRLIIAHLNAMRRIRSFSWIDVSCEFTWGLNNILAHDDLLRILKSSTTLKSVMIQFAPQFIEDRIDLAQNSCFLPLKGFKNLASLELYDFTGEKERLTKEIADVLRQNPGLKTLGLGIACDVDDSDEGIVLEYPADFFESLCSAYVSSKGRPLALETLRLGHGMCLHPPYDQEDLIDKHPDDHYVHGLLDVKSLKTVQVYNGLTVDSELDEDIFPDLDWSPFSVKQASLHRISVTMLDCETAEWLSTSGKSVKELIVSNDYRIGDPDIDNFTTLTNNLTMLYTKERCGSRFTDDDLSYSVLDRLQDCGGSLQKLSLSLDFETQWDLFSSHLTKMTYLTELRLSARTFRPYDGQYPHPSSSLWPGIKECEELARRYIRLMSTLCPSLQYVMIGHRAWQICRPNEALMRYPTRRRLACELRRLPFDEIRGIELFALTPAPEHTGLIRPTLERDELEIMDTPMPPALLDMLRWNHMYDF